MEKSLVSNECNYLVINELQCIKADEIHYPKNIVWSNYDPH